MHVHDKDPGLTTNPPPHANVPPPFPPSPRKVEADRGEDLGTVHRSLPLSEYLHALCEEKKAKAAKIAENGGGGGSGGEDGKKKRSKSKRNEVRGRVLEAFFILRGGGG